MRHLAAAVLVCGAFALPAWRSLSARGFTVGLLALTAAGLLLRDPTIWTHPRFYAEEGFVYVQAAWDMPTWQALIAPHLGYYALFANAAALVAAAAPLAQGPLVTTSLAALVPLGTTLAIATSSAEGLRERSHKAMATVAALVVGASGEMWLNTINSQHWMPLIAFLMLIDGKETRLKRAVCYGAAVVCGLSSVAANFLTPLFLLRYWRERHRADGILFLLFCATSLIQLGFIAYSAFVTPDPVYVRFPGGVPFQVALRGVGDFGLAYPLFGRFHGIYRIAPFVLTAAFVACWPIRSRLSIYWLAAAWITVLSVLGSLGMKGSERYAYAPAVILNLGLLWASTEPLLPGVRRLFVGAVWLAATGAWLMAFGPTMRVFHDPTWPDWREEAAHWRANPGYRPHIHPQWEDEVSKGEIWSVNPPAWKRTLPD